MTNPAPPPFTGDPQAKPSAGPVLGWALIALFSYLAIAALAAAIGGAVDADLLTARTDLLIRFVVGGIGAVLVGFAAIPYIAMQRQSVRPPAWRRPRAVDIGWAVLLLAASYGTIYVYTAIIEAIGADNLIPSSTIEAADFRATVLITAVNGLWVILIVPFAEEMFFRRFVLGGLRLAWRTAPALIISAALFAVLHADLGSMIPFAIIGLLFGFAYIRSNSLTAPTIAHLAFNTVGFSHIVSKGIG